VSYGTSTPASIYAELIVEERITETGIVCPEEPAREVLEAFLAECGKRGLSVTRTKTLTVTQ
jgi:saccharopine dehydrogenase-like NADP-dependent oxidoreductase